MIHISVCTIKECYKKIKSKGYCTRHYQRFRNCGKATNENLNEPSPKYCKNENCNNKHYSIGLCQYHYMKIQNKMFEERNPEYRLIATKKRLKKYGRSFNMNLYEYSYALNYWSKTIKKRDNYTCKNCDSKKKLNAHHIKPKKYFPELALELDNGVTLCKKCHGELHGFEIY